MSLEQVARSHYRRRRLLVEALAAVAKRLWLRVDSADIARSWTAQLPELVALTNATQIAAARSADDYVAEVLDAQGITTAAEGRLMPASVAGVASDGRPLATLLYEPAIRTLTAVGAGAEVDRALAGGYAALNTMVRTQIADAGRAADQVALVARPAVSGWVRMVVGRTCGRCVVLAGRRYSWQADFDRHPHCFPAGVVVSGPANLAASRRLYQGELVVIRTASGQELPATGNHPVLTDRGWLPANLVQEGDHVVRSTRSQGAAALVVPHEDQMPARIEDLWRPDGVVPLLHMPTTAEDFHGDGGHGDVDVVLADRLLRNGFDAAARQLAEQKQLAGRIDQAALLTQGGTPKQEVHRLLRAAHGVVGGGGLPLALVGRHASGAHLSRCGHVADLDAGLDEPSAYNVTADAVAAAEAVLALAGRVRGCEFGDRQVEVDSRWDAPSGPLTVESRLAYARRGQDLLLRLAGQVELDRVVELRRVQWSGHVYNLTSVEGWYSANGLIVSNCDCIAVPAGEDTTDDIRTNPRAWFDSLDEAEQNRQFTVAGAQAIRDGADIAQVVNARRGAFGLTPAGARITGPEARMLRGGRDRGRLEVTDVFGHPLYVTTEGTTTRGQAGIRLGARRDRVKVEGARYTSAKAPRLMPESIYQLAGGNRDEAIRLLRRFGYIT